MTELMQYLPAYIQALGVTLWLSLCAAFGGILLGFALNGLCSKHSLAFRLWRVYVWIIRGPPFLAQLAVIYFGLPSLGIMLSAVEATLLSLMLYSAAYFGEIFRAAWNSIPPGQREAALANNISARGCFWHIQTPQAVRFALPLLGN